MTSGGLLGRHTGVGGLVALQPRLGWSSAVRTKPSILPPSMSAAASVRLWPAPPFTRFGSWYGLSQPLVRGSGAHTVNRPLLAGMPSAPG
jgi:hypothetical protein